MCDLVWHVCSCGEEYRCYQPDDLCPVTNGYDDLCGKCQDYDESLEKEQALEERRNRSREQWASQFDYE